MPVYYRSKELGILKGSPILSKIRQLKIEMFSDYLVFKQVTQDSPYISFNEFAHYRCLVASRVFGFELNGIQTGGLVPLIGKIDSVITRYAKS